MAKFEIQANAIARIVGNASDANPEKVEAIRQQLMSAYNSGLNDKSREIRSALNID